MYLFVLFCVACFGLFMAVLLDVSGAGFRGSCMCDCGCALGGILGAVPGCFSGRIWWWI